VAGAIDVPSVVLSAVAFGGLVYGLSGIGESAAGHAPVAPWIPLAIGAVAITAFVSRQIALKDHALLDLRALSTSTYAVAVVLVGVNMMALFGSLILLPIYLQSVLGLSTLASGLILLPGGLAMGLLAPFVGRIFDRVGPRPLVLPGSAIASAALWLMTAFDTQTTQGAVIAVHVLLSMGLALMLTPLMTSALGSLPQHLYPHGSAIVTTVQQVAGAAGTAIFITVMTRGQVAGARDGLSVVDATGEGIHTAFICGGVISALALVIAFAVRRPAANLH
jgi:DHA2 family lincomycin resistance protein-like MFS transporter